MIDCVMHCRNNLLTNKQHIYYSEQAVRDRQLWRRLQGQVLGREEDRRAVVGHRPTLPLDLVHQIQQLSRSTFIDVFQVRF